ncbi:hypothetical protein STRAU_0518 [Streptomyces aurantiacus JA 4570]|uniref:Uncharacterized protein n=1 Tax=Streptomyces aurantiacus JA 4570 TaxID=1286094 RepID=S3ZT05_9ACTN|nr:hypothetical protein STRAU_0518 [Streptomyces aurantiacus JA 4570]
MGRRRGRGLAGWRQRRWPSWFRGRSLGCRGCCRRVGSARRLRGRTPRRLGHRRTGSLRRHRGRTTGWLGRRRRRWGRRLRGGPLGWRRHGGRQPVREDAPLRCAGGPPGRVGLTTA